MVARRLPHPALCRSGEDERHGHRQRRPMYLSVLRPSRADAALALLRRTALNHGSCTLCSRSRRMVRLRTSTARSDVLGEWRTLRSEENEYAWRIDRCRVGRPREGFLLASGPLRARIVCRASDRRRSRPRPSDRCPSCVGGAERAWSARRILKLSLFVSYLKAASSSQFV
eukprot:scaffold7557_cov128-Isochrysis_galbana.AAC.3